MSVSGSLRPLSRSAGVLGRVGRLIGCRRCAHDFIRGPTPGGTFKVPLKSPKIVGVCSSRGNRAYQEDATSVRCLQLKTEELQASLAQGKVDWDPSKAGSSFLASQVAYFAIFDGHGGKDVSSFVSQHLHDLIETVDPSTAADVVDWTIERHAGYFRRWKGGVLQEYIDDVKARNDKRIMTLEERLTLAYLTADKQILEGIGKAERCGSTSTAVLLHSLDEPATPYWGAKKLQLTVAHCGDTRALLCHRPTGEAIALTEKHHAEARVESARLRRMGADRLVSDSFGESRWMGVVENTRGFGDGEWKPSGITAEPEITSQILNGEDYSYIILVTDGLNSLMSDQEIVDLARNSIDPTRAAKTIVHFGEDLGAQDNCTCVVVPLAGWGKVGGRDNTEERREYRRKQAGMLNTRMQRM